MVITNEMLADAICSATASDEMLTQWASNNSYDSAVGFQTLHEKPLTDAINANPQRLIDAPAEGVALLFSFASFDVLLPIVKIGMSDPYFIKMLVDRLLDTTETNDESVWTMIRGRALTRLSALQTLDLLRSVHVTTTPIMADLAKRMPNTFQATVT